MFIKRDIILGTHGHIICMNLYQILAVNINLICRSSFLQNLDELLQRIIKFLNLSLALVHGHEVAVFEDVL